ncbi:MAG: DUF1460 domain-containing protein [Deltaproteobacteria bacterium]|nr:DUF1460 domain-containing protein [Deltaproteobacteria bacterium]
MTNFIKVFLALTLIVIFQVDSYGFEKKINLGNWSQGEVESIIKKSSQSGSSRQKINSLSSHFLGTEYQGNTLIGGPHEEEVFVVNLSKVDCFTFLDYMEAFRYSASFPEFEKNLMNIRYKSGNVSYVDRNHFFTDWEKNNAPLVDDVTLKVGRNKVKKVLKTLNLKKDGSKFLEGIPNKKRVLYYIPSDLIDENLIKRLKSGDYVGIYSKTEGLDVSHVGLLIKNEKEVLFRHASSRHKKVLDEGFLEYIAQKPGIIILRPRQGQ